MIFLRFLSIHNFHYGTDYIFTLVRGKVLRSHIAPTPPLGRIVDRDAALPRPADFPLLRRRVGRHTLLLQLFLPSFTLFLLALHASHGVKALGVSSISPCHRHTLRCEVTLYVCSFSYRLNRRNSRGSYPVSTIALQRMVYSRKQTSNQPLHFLSILAKFHF